MGEVMSGVEGLDDVILRLVASNHEGYFVHEIGGCGPDLQIINTRDQKADKRKKREEGGGRK